MRIGVDVDNTIIHHHIDDYWDWLHSITEYKSTAKFSLLDYQNPEYAIHKYFQEELNKRGLDGLEWWRNENLYDIYSPSMESIKYLNELRKRGHEIIFISQIKGNHHKSKYNFVERNFPYLKGFIATKEKELVDVDVMIDDRNRVLNRFNGKKTLLLRMYTPYTQEEILSQGTLVEDFKQAYEEIKNYE